MEPKEGVKMKKDLLPIGSLIELNDGRKLIIISYEKTKDNKLTYLCGGYPSYFLMDLIPATKINEFKQKYKFYNIDDNIEVGIDFKVIHTGYKDKDFENLKQEFKSLNLL